MPTIFSGVENRIAKARERHQELHRTTRQDVADWRTQAARITTTIGALYERQEALDAKTNAALSLSVLAATISLIALTRR